MKVIMVNPPQLIFKGEPYYCLREECCWGVGKINISLPGQMTQITGVLKADGQNIKQIDANVEGIRTKDINLGDAEVVIAMCCVELTLENDLEILKKAKAEGRITIAVINDPYYTFEIMDDYPFIDYYIREDRANVIKNLLNLLDQGHDKGIPTEIDKIKGLIYRQGDVVKSTGIQEPTDTWSISNYDGLALEKYNRAIVVTGYGCPYVCTFCHFQSGKRKTRPVSMVVEDIKRLKEYGYNDFYMMDLELTIDKKYLNDLCEALTPLKIKWLCDGRVNEVNKELLAKMALAGCKSITYGIESGSMEILKNIKKAITPELALERVKWTAEAGITPYVCFMVGFPWETEKTMQETEDLMKQMVPKYTDSYSLNFLRPIPNTTLYNFMIEQKLIKKERPQAMPRGSAVHYWELEPTCNSFNLNKEQIKNFRKRVLEELYKRRVYNLGLAKDNIKKFIKYPLKDKINLIKKALP